MPIYSARRRGFALAAAIMAIVVVGAIIAGAFFASTQDYRIGRNTLVEQRAFAVAEYGLNKEVGNWDRSRNLAPPAGLPIGTVIDTNVYVAGDDTARVRITRLTRNTYWVVSEGRASIGNAQTQSMRRTNAIVKLAYPAVNVRGAITTAGDIDVRGGATVSGNDVPDTQLLAWQQCDSIGRDSLAGIAATKTAKIDSSSAISGTPPVVRDSVAADSNTYVRYGSETWNTLRDNADIRLSASLDPFPAGTATTCNTTGANHNTNWGEPYHVPAPSVAVVVPGCWNYFPIIYVDGNLTISGNGRGQGILLINGDFRVQGTFDFYGIIIVRDDIERGNGTAQIHGAVMARNMTIGDGSVWSGTQDVRFSKCAVESALSGSAILVPTRERGWAQLF
jgi:hypothetical protein